MSVRFKLPYFDWRQQGAAIVRAILVWGAILVLLSGSARVLAQTMPTLYESRAGNLNFTGAQRTLRTASNNSNACSVYSSGTTTQTTLSGIPSGATVEAAYLYWAGSGGTADYNVTFDGNFVSAPSNRRYTASFYSGGTTYRYFSGVADVTSVVAAKGGGAGNGTYSFSGLSVDSGSTYCATEAVLAGWSLLVIYSHPSEEFRVLNLYEGFQTFQYNSFTLNLSNFNVPSTFTKGRIAHLTWEGDPTLSGGGENLTFNGTTMNNASNPIGNQFNSISTITGTPENTSHGIDFDVYDLTSPIIQAGQTSATTTYSSGQDLVLLSAEIVAMPNVPVADLGIDMTRTGTAQLGQNVSYSLIVTNYGPYPEPGPVTVTDILPSQLSYVSATGTGWSCSIADQTVSCTYSSPLAVGASTPELLLTARIVSGSPTTLTNTATVSGVRFDNVSTNDSASDSTTISIPSYAFTDAECEHNAAFGSPGQTCNILSWGPLTAGQDLTNVYVTNLNGSGVPTRLHRNNTRYRTVQFGLSCHNPTSHAGVQATFTAVSGYLPLCASNGAEPSGSIWSPTSGNGNNLEFPGGSPSSGPYTFSYKDVGRVELFLKESGSSSAEGSSGAFVVKPHTFVLSNISCTPPNAANCGGGALPSGANPAATSATGPTFIRAGHPFTVTVSAQNLQGTATPNFGHESPAESVQLAVTEINPSGGVDPGITGTFGSFSTGTASGASFRWNEVGIIRITPSVADGDYLGAGNVTGIQSGWVGRFYPHHFGVAGSVITRSAIPVTTTTGSINAGGTTLTVASADNISRGHELLVAGAGPAGSDLIATVAQMSGTSITLSAPASQTVSGANVTKPPDDFTYMGESMRLQVQVTAYSASDTVTRNYTGAFARLGQAALGVGPNWFAIGCSGTSTCFGLGAVNGATALTSRLGVVNAFPEAWAAGVGSFSVDVALAKPTTTSFDATWGPYDVLQFGAAPRDPDGVALPTLSSDPAHGMDLDADLDGTGTAERRELFTTRVRLGRLRLMSAHGSERQPLPVGVSVQYWNGSNYVTNTLDNNSRFTPGNVQLANYLGNLTNGETSVVGTPSSISFVNGVAQYLLAKPGGGDGQYGGSVDMSINLPASGLGFLTGNTGRARFGVFKGSKQFIYMRENF